MKEAAGEANLTVVAIILIAVIVAIATPLINSLMRNSTRRACCTDAGGVWEDNDCGPAANDTTGQFDGQSYQDCVDSANND